MDGEEKFLYATIAKLKTPDECKAFFKDLCTPKEIKDMKDRLQVAKLLLDGKLSYREISEKTKVSLTTITRVARFITQESYQGYKLAIGKDNEKSKTSSIRPSIRYL
jgi:TrpR-related protein YerC/YecD